MQHTCCETDRSTALLHHLAALTLSKDAVELVAGVAQLHAPAYNMMSAPTLPAASCTRYAAALSPCILLMLLNRTPPVLPLLR
jgi:hypothetical protein